MLWPGNMLITVAYGQLCNCYRVEATWPQGYIFYQVPCRSFLRHSGTYFMYVRSLEQGALLPLSLKELPVLEAGPNAAGADFYELNHNGAST